MFSKPTTLSLLAIGIACSSISDRDETRTDMSSSFNTTALGCSDFMVYRADSSGMNYLVVEGNADSLHIDTNLKSYSIPETPYLSVYIDKYLNVLRVCLPYCNDIICGQDSTVLEDKYTATNGLVEISKSPDYHGTTTDFYFIKIRLKNVSLRTDSHEVFLKDVYFDSIFVGPPPG